MARVFDVDVMVGVPAPSDCALLVTARLDLDVSTESAARQELRQVVRGSAAAVVLDLSGVFVGVTVLRCLRDLAGGRDGAGPAVVAVGGPAWLTAADERLGLPPFGVARSVAAAVATLRA
jgi:hypothetical protein